MAPASYRARYMRTKTDTPQASTVLPALSAGMRVAGAQSRGSPAGVPINHWQADRRGSDHCFFQTIKNVGGVCKPCVGRPPALKEPRAVAPVRGWTPGVMRARVVRFGPLRCSSGSADSAQTLFKQWQIGQSDPARRVIRLRRPHGDQACG
jgi:hypothetical protein